MSIENVPVQEQVPAQPTEQAQNQKAAAAAVAAQPAATEQDTGLEQGVAQLSVQQPSGLSVPPPVVAQPSPDNLLHKACAEGNVEEVRAVLGRGLDSLETLDLETGCTPIVLAIRNGHADVVRELLTAGAIVPPPGLTNDPAMLALLYPQPLFGIPPPYANMPMGAPEFYPQNGFYQQPPPAHFGQQQPRKDSSPNGQALPANLPPAEVSKTIPCRNFPHCKYGNACVFFHPNRAGFYPNGPVPGQEFSAGFPGFNPAPYFVPNGFNAFSVQPNGDAPAAPVENATAQQPPSDAPTGPAATEDATTSTTSAPAPIPNAQGPSAGAPVFIPTYPQPHLGSPPGPSQFGLSPMSPSMLAGSLPSIPPAEAFFAQSPPNPGFIPNGFQGNPRRQSFGQPFGGPKAFHGKKPSFSGGPRPFRNGSTGNGANGSANLGAWKDGNPPPCAFFSQGKCRNGEFCKFPHLDENGTDCRHPDVVRGVIPPLPTLGRQNRTMRGPTGFTHLDPALRHQQIYAQHNGAHPQAIPEGDAPAPDAEAAPTAPAAEQASSEEATTTDKPALPASVPAKPAASPLPSVARSASQPGIQRVHANGFNSRSHSPAPSNTSFHGNGHPRRGARGGFANGRSTSGEPRAPPQRVPRADEFPALAGGSTSPSLNAGEKKDAKTAAQILSAPAPYRPAKVADIPAAPAAETNGDAHSEHGESVSMEDEPDSDAVIVSKKSTPAPALAPAASPRKGVSASFASVITAATPAAPATSEIAPVGVQA